MRSLQVVALQLVETVGCVSQVVVGYFIDPSCHSCKCRCRSCHSDSCVYESTFVNLKKHLHIGHDHVMARRSADAVVPLQVVALQQVETAGYVPHIAVWHFAPRAALTVVGGIIPAVEAVTGTAVWH